MELLEYVLRNGALGGRSDGLPDALWALVAEGGGAVLSIRAERGIRVPREEPDDAVSRESPPSSRDPDATGGMGGKGEWGVRKPFFVLTTEVGLEFPENMFFALGADATRRSSRVAVAPIPFGERGFGREAEEGEGRAKDVWDGFAVCALDRPRVIRSWSCFSDLVRTRCWGRDSASIDG